MPLLVIAPAEVAQAVNGELWIGISHSDPNYGGCHVFVSYDDSSYKILATHKKNAIQGRVVGTFNPSATTLVVNVAMSRSVLENVSALEKDSAGSLCRVNNEWLSYQDVTLIGAFSYELSGLNRGLYGSNNGANSDDLFTVCDNRILRLPINAAWNGNTIFFKFQAFNVFDKSPQELSGVAAYSIDVPLVTKKQSAAYIHYQTNAETTWTINHNLGRPVSIECYENDGDKINGKNNHVNNSQSKIMFSQAVAGYAVVN